MLRGFGEEGQTKLKESHAVIAGIGGLGCAAAVYLACAGVGHITLVDDETVELANLNRQILHWEEDVGKKKASSAAQKLSRINPSILVTPAESKMDANKAHELVKAADVVLDGLDNFEARSLLNHACVAQGVPFIHGGIWGLNGQVTTIIPGKTPCFACIYPRRPTQVEPVPVIGVSPALVAIIQASEAIKLMAGIGRPLAGRMLLVNQGTMDFSFRELVKNPDCAVCGTFEEQEE